MELDWTSCDGLIRWGFHSLEPRVKASPGRPICRISADYHSPLRYGPHCNGAHTWCYDSGLVATRPFHRMVSVTTNVPDLKISDRAFETHGTCSRERDSVLAPRWMRCFRCGILSGVTHTITVHLILNKLHGIPRGNRIYTTYRRL